MKETIIFAPGLSGTELLRSLAKFGINTFGYRVMNAVDLSRMAFMKSGIALTAAFLPRKDEPAVIDSILRDIPYFKSASYADAESMAAALYTLRSLIPEEELTTIHKCLPQGEFPEKNALEWQEDPNNKEKPGSVDHQHFPVRSGQRDLNPRPLDPQSSALPSYAIPRAACFLLPATANIPKIKAFVNWSSSKIIRQLFCCVCLCKGLQSLLWALRPFLCCAGKCGRIGAAAKEETR